MAKLRKKIKIGDGCMTAILIALLFVVIYAISWICTCGIIKLITMCFGLTFSWAIANRQEDIKGEEQWLLSVQF